MTKNEIKLREVIKKYVDKKSLNRKLLDICGNKESTLNNILSILFKHENLDIPLSPIHIATDKLHSAMRDCAQSYSRSKMTIINVYDEIVKELDEEGINFTLERPNINLDSKFERQLFMIKYFHPEENHTKDDYLDEMWMFSEDTFKEDYKGIKNGELTFLNRKVVMDAKRHNNEVKFESTGHPLLLIENLTQVILILEGLRKPQSEIFELYAEATSIEIWSQLSKYARERIKYVVKEMMDGDIWYYEALDEKVDQIESESIFHTERSLSTYAKTNSASFFMKEYIDCYIEYRDNNIIKKIKGRIRGITQEDRLKVFDFSSNEIIYIKCSDVEGLKEIKK